MNSQQDDACKKSPQAKFSSLGFLYRDPEGIELCRVEFDELCDIVNEHAALVAVAEAAERIFNSVPEWSSLVDALANLKAIRNQK